MKKYTIIFLVFFIFGCHNTNKTDEVIAITENLADAFESFSNIVDILNNLTSDVTVETKEKLVINLEKDAFNDVARNWESSWKEIDTKVVILEAEYDGVVAESSKYFEKMRELEMLTQDSVSRNQMKMKTDAKMKDFENAKANALKEIDRMKEMVRRGGGFHNMLLQDVMLTQIDYRILDLNRIENAASEVCVRLNRFAKDGSMMLK